MIVISQIHIERIKGRPDHLDSLGTHARKKIEYLLLKIGQTTRSVKGRVAEQLKTAAIKNFTIELDEPAEREDGTFFTDYQVRAALARKGLTNHELEWMRCTVADVHTVS